MAIVSKTIKLAGPDSLGTFKVITTKNTMLVLPGELYKKDVIEKRLMPLTRGHGQSKVEVTFVEPKREDMSELDDQLVLKGVVRPDIHLT